MLLRSQVPFLQGGFINDMVSSLSYPKVHEANLVTFKTFRKTIDHVTHWPSAPLGDQGGLTWRIEHWRKAIARLTLWFGDVRAYYALARPEIVCLLEASVLVPLSIDCWLFMCFGLLGSL